MVAPNPPELLTGFSTPQDEKFGLKHTINVPDFHNLAITISPDDMVPEIDNTNSRRRRREVPSESEDGAFYTSSG